MNADLFGVLEQAWPLLSNGLQMTVYVTVISLVIAMFLGIFTCLLNISKVPVLRGIAKFYIWLIRGTPMLVQGFYLYLAVPQVVQATVNPDFRIDIVTASVITLTLNAGAYLSRSSAGPSSRSTRARWRLHARSASPTPSPCRRSSCRRPSASACRAS